MLLSKLIINTLLEVDCSSLCHKVIKKEMFQQLENLSIFQRGKADWGRQINRSYESNLSKTSY